MKISAESVLLKSNILLISAIIVLVGLCAYVNTASARVISSVKEGPRIQDDDTDIAPPMNPGSPQEAEPRDLDDPVYSPGTTISDPDSLNDQSDSGIMEDKSETGDDSDSADESDSEVEEPSPDVNGDETVLNEPDSEVEEPLPLVNEAQPQLEQPETVVPEGVPQGGGD